jgi:tRNA splicing endonuclease
MVIKSQWVGERVITEPSDAARELYNQSRFGKILADGSVHLALHEALYLIEKKKIKVYDRKKELDIQTFINKARVILH